MESASVSLGSHCFTLLGNRNFARGSGDHNPIHIDPEAARRLLFGEPVVHGAHVLLQAIDRVASGEWAEGGSISRVHAMFRQPVFLDEDVEFVVEVVTESQLRVQVLRAKGLLATIFLQTDASGVSIPSLRSTPQPPNVTGAADLQIHDLEERSGRIRVPAGDGSLASAFPAATKLLGARAVEEVGSITCLVGMRCPGLHSVLLDIDVRLGTDDPSPDMTWSVARVNEALSAVRIAVNGYLNGSVNVFLRPRPVEQPSATELSQRVSDGEFVGVRALLIGGSRGLGEVTAKLLAAGGADVALSYRTGRHDADRVAAEINRAGGTASVVQLDVGADRAQLAKQLRPVTDRDQLFYFASPRITTRRLWSFDTDHFAALLNIYATGFLSVVEELRLGEQRPLSVLYPSTIFIDSWPDGLTEYAMAKAAGEAAARLYASQNDDVELVIERFAPMETDQTAGRDSARAARAGSLVDALLPAVRRVALRNATGHA